MSLNLKSFILNTFRWRYICLWFCPCCCLPITGYMCL